MRRCRLALAAASALLVTSSVLASDGWSVSKLVPFQKSSSSSGARATVSDTNSSWLHLPTWGQKPASKSQSREPSTLDKLSQGTKKTWDKTVDLLTPWDNQPKKSSAKSSKKSSKKSSWYSSWIPQKKSKPKEARTVKDFLGQPRPEF